MLIISLIKVSLSNPGFPNEDYKKVFSLIPKQFIEDKISNRDQDKLIKSAFIDNTIPYLSYGRKLDHNDRRGKNNKSTTLYKSKKFGRLSSKHYFVKSNKKFLPIILEESSILESERKENSIESFGEKDFFNETIDIRRNKKNGKHYRTCKFCLIFKVILLKLA
jgi:hypothetical protein